MNTIIQTDFCEFGYEYKFYHTHNQTKRCGYGYKSYKSMQIDELMHYNIQSMVLGLKKISSFS